MRLRLKQGCISIEISKDSKYFDLVTKKIQNSYNLYWENNRIVIPEKEQYRREKENFLKTLYYLCAYNANYQNPKFLKKLLENSSKRIELVTKDALHVKSEQRDVNHYALLNSNESDPLHVIRKRYLHLAKTYHPDRVASKNPSLVQVYTQKFQKIQEAYEVLKYNHAS